MAGKNDFVDVDENWTRLTNEGATVTRITMRNYGPKDVLLNGSTGAVPSSTVDAGFPLKPGEILDDYEITKIFGGTPGATQVFGRCSEGNTRVYISHV